MSTLRSSAAFAGLLLPLLVSPAPVQAQSRGDPTGVLPAAGGLSVADLPDLPHGLCAPDWEAAFGGSPGIDDPNYAGGGVLSAAVFDDGLGGGPALYVGGRFISAGGVPTGCVARWNGSEWSSLGPAGGPNWDVMAMAVWNDGSGPALFIGGDFNTVGGVPMDRLCKWDGVSFTALGTGANAAVRALTPWSTIMGSKLVLGGDFTTVGGVSASRIASWNGSVFAQVADGFNGPVNAVHPMGPQLMAGGAFTANAAGTTPLLRLAGTGGATWAAIDGGTNGPVYVLDVLDSGAGVKLHVGGAFTTVGSPALSSEFLASWGGGGWTSFGTDLDTTVRALAMYDDGGGPALHVAAGSWLLPGVPSSYVARWNGGGWSVVDGPVGSCDALVVHDDGSGESLWVVGQFSSIDDVACNSVARWDGSDWWPTQTGFQHWIHALCESTLGGTGTPGLFIGGFFYAPGMVGQRFLAWWRDGAHQPFASTDGTVRAILEFDDGGGPALYVAGEFTHIDGMPAERIARWDGSTWSALGGGLDARVHALGVFDDGGGPALYAAGEFTTAGGAPALRVARWDGSTWSPLGAGLGSPGSGLALLSWDDGSGPALYVAGNFNTGWGGPGDGIARWDGTSWSSLGTGLAVGGGRSLKLFDDGSGERLYVGGSFNSADGVPDTGNIASWDGTTWASVGGGTSNTVFALEAHDDGTGPALFAGGYFSAVAGWSVPASFVARWDGTTWSPLGSGVDHGVYALESIDDGSGAGPRLAVGGQFTAVPDTLPGAGASHLAFWGGCWSTVNNWTDLGYALPGVSGNPLLVGTGSLALDSYNTVMLSNAAPSALAGLFISFASTPVPFAGGTLVPVPFLDPILITTSPLGEIPIPFIMPPGVAPGTTLYVQWAISDTAAVAGIALSNAIRGDVP